MKKIKNKKKKAIEKIIKKIAGKGSTILGAKQGDVWNYSKSKAEIRYTKTEVRV